eukprot:143769-Rhodomonas_salina.2
MPIPLLKLPSKHAPQQALQRCWQRVYFVSKQLRREHFANARSITEKTKPEAAQAISLCCPRQADS